MDRGREDGEGDKQEEERFLGVHSPYRLAINWCLLCYSCFSYLTIISNSVEFPSFGFVLGSMGHFNSDI